MTVTSAVGRARACTGGWPSSWCGAAREAAGQTIAPSRGCGMSQTFTVRFEDPAGAASLPRAWVWFTASFLGGAAHSGQVSSDRPVHRRTLVTDAGTAWVSAALGTSGVLQNRACSIGIAHSAAVMAGTTVTLTLPVRFTAACTESTAQPVALASGTWQAIHGAAVHGFPQRACSARPRPSFPLSEN